MLSNLHSMDTHGYSEMVFAVSHLIGMTTFALRIKDSSAQNLVSFAQLKTDLISKGYPIKPAYDVNENKIRPII
jgi:TnpA family transposase